MYETRPNEHTTWKQQGADFVTVIPMCNDVDSMYLKLNDLRISFGVEIC